MYRTIRGIVTVARAEAAEGTRKRPMPVLFVGTKTSSGLSQQWQARLSESGFDSAIAHLDGNDTMTGDKLLQSWYHGVRGKVREMGMFPPVMVGHGEAAWRLCQKYVANEPLSGLVLVDGPSSVDPQTLPSFEFEPYFPIMAVAEAPNFLLEDMDLIEAQDNDEQAMEQVLEWIQDNF
ncbi:hypothetical protein BJV82DRAFT_587948 [Fennellomyces sp. T-0311]|nr:hypothetical protein BJV82DRAFT_587948 [Fennellomyces sp. T-0311]